MIDVKSGVQCRYCGAELYEAEFVVRSGWPLRKDPPSVHFCNEDCRNNFAVHGKRNADRGQRTTDTATRTADEEPLIDRFEDDAV